MKLLLLVGYFVITVISSAVYITTYHTIYARYNLFVLVSTIPGFFSGIAGDNKCDNIFECAHYICKYNLTYTSLSPHDDCDMTGRAMYGRYSDQQLQLEITVTYYMVMINMYIGLFLSCLIPIVTFTIKNIPNVMNAVTVFIIIMSNIVTSMFIIYINITLNNVRPYTPTFYAYVDTNISHWQIGIIVTNLIIILSVLSYLVIHVSRIDESDVKDAILFFSTHQPEKVNKSLNDDHMFDINDFHTDDDDEE